MSSLSFSRKSVRKSAAQVSVPSMTSDISVTLSVTNEVVRFSRPAPLAAPSIASRTSRLKSRSRHTSRLYYILLVLCSSPLIFEENRNCSQSTVPEVRASLARRKAHVWVTRASNDAARPCRPQN